MDCDALHRLLEEGTPLRTFPQPETDAHLAGCPACRKEWEAFRLIQERFVEIGPGPTSAGDFVRRVQAALPRPSGGRSPSSTALGSDATWVPGWLSPLAAVLGMVLLLVASGWWSARPPAPPRYPTGSLEAAGGGEAGLLEGVAGLRREGRLIGLPAGSGRFPLRTGDVLILNENEPVTVRRPTGETILLAGVGEAAVASCEISIAAAWRGRLVFQKRASFFRVRFPTVTLGIRGTIVQARQEGQRTDVWIEEGTVDWSHSLTGRSGRLQSGQGIRASGAGVAPLTGPLFGAGAPTPAGFPRAGGAEPSVPRGPDGPLAVGESGVPPRHPSRPGSPSSLGAVGTAAVVAPPTGSTSATVGTHAPEDPGGEVATSIGGIRDAF